LLCLPILRLTGPAFCVFECWTGLASICSMEGCMYRTACAQHRLCFYLTFYFLVRSSSWLFSLRKSVSRFPTTASCEGQHCFCALFGDDGGFIDGWVVWPDRASSWSFWGPCLGMEYCVFFCVSRVYAAVAGKR
jgi:hypothetical protein